MPRYPQIYCIKPFIYIIMEEYNKIKTTSFEVKNKISREAKPLNIYSSNIVEFKTILFKVLIRTQVLINISNF